MSVSEEQIRALLSAEKKDSFAPFFSDRVMRRVQQEFHDLEPEQDSLYDALRWVFLRISAAAIVLIVALGLLNVTQFGAADGASWIDALLGLPSDALTDVLTYNLI
jgi:hypothetical protein